MELVNQLTRDHLAKQDNAESPGAGRAKLRLSRGFPLGLGCDVVPYGIGQPIDKGIRESHLARQDDAESPGSDGASPYLPALSRPRRHLLSNWSTN